MDKRLSPVKELEGKVIDIAIHGASRPDLLEITIDTFKENVTFDGKLRWILQDALLDPDRAEQCRQIALKHNFDVINIEAFLHEKTDGGSYGLALTNTLEKFVRAPLMFSLEEDWKCLRPINLNDMWDIFQEVPSISQLVLNRRTNVDKSHAYRDENGIEHYKMRYVERTYTVNGKTHKFLNSRHWHFTPAIWRMSFIRPLWKGFDEHIHHRINSEEGILPKDRSVYDPDWRADVLGTLTYGPKGEQAFFQHLGTGDRSIRLSQGGV